MAGSWLSCPHCQTLFFHGEEVPPLLCPACKKPLALPAEEASEPEWFYIENKKKHGPVTRGRLNGLAAAGKIGRGDMVLEKGTTKWLAAGAIPGLVPSEPASSAAAPVETGPQWYYLENGQQSGPVGLEAMKKLIITGRLLIAGNVLPKGSSQWVPVVSVKELFPKAETTDEPPPTPPRPPTPGPPEKPPTPEVRKTAPIMTEVPVTASARTEPPTPAVQPAAAVPHEPKRASVEARPAVQAATASAPAIKAPESKLAAPEIKPAAVAAQPGAQASPPKPAPVPPKPAAVVVQPAIPSAESKPAQPEPKPAPSVVEQPAPAAPGALAEPKPVPAQAQPAVAKAPTAAPAPAPFSPPVPECSPQETIERFERAWMQGRRPELDDCLPANPELRHCLLPALVGIDLHCRLNCQEAIRVESYLERYPELAENRDAVVELVALEYQHRRLSQNDAPAEEYLKRFPQYEAKLRPRLEALAPKPIAAPAVPPVEAKTQEKTTAEAPAVAPTKAKAAPAAEYPAIPGHEIEGIVSQDERRIVYRARHVKLKRPVALHLILATGSAAQRLLQDAATAARLHHPNIVELYETGEYEGHPYLSFEFTDGGTLAQRLNGTPVAPRIAAELVEKLASALHYAHGQGTIHGDVNPATVLLATDSMKTAEKEAEASIRAPLAALAPKIANFGLGKSASVTSIAPSYLAPEQAAGRANEIGPATDIFATGAILYELLTGRPPFKGETDEDTLAQIQTHEPAAPSALQPKVPRDLDTICLKCLAKLPDKRYGSAGELAQDLGRFLAGKPIVARPTPLHERARDFAKQKPTAAAALGAVALVVLIFFGGCYGSYRDARRQKDYAEVAAAKARDALREASTRGDEAQQRLLAAERDAARDRVHAQAAQESERQARASEQQALAQGKAARESERKALEESAKLRTALDQGALAWHRLHAEQWEKAGQWTAALYHLGRLIDLNPADERLLVRRADAYRRSGQWLLAAVDYSRALELKPDLSFKDQRDLCLGRSPPIQAGAAAGLMTGDPLSVFLTLQRLTVRE